MRESFVLIISFFPNLGHRTKTTWKRIILSIAQLTLPLFVYQPLLWFNQPPHLPTFSLPTPAIHPRPLASRQRRCKAWGSPSSCDPRKTCEVYSLGSSCETLQRHQLRQQRLANSDASTQEPNSWRFPATPPCTNGNFFFLIPTTTRQQQQTNLTYAISAVYSAFSSFRQVLADPLPRTLD